MRHKKGQIGGLQTIIIGLVILAFLMGIGLSLLSKLKANSCEQDGYFVNTTTNQCHASSTNATIMGGYAINSTSTVLDATDDIPGWLGIIVLAFIAVIVLAIVYLLQRRAKG